MGGHFDAANALLRHGNVTGAIERLRRALAEDPEDADAHALLALCLLAQDEKDAATAEAQVALELDPEGPSGHHALGVVLERRGLRRRAEQHFKMLVELAPDDAGAYRVLGEHYAERGARDRAREALEKARSLDPGDPDILAALAREHLAAGDPAAAAAEADDAVRLDPEHLAANLVIGHLHLRAGRVDEAREHLVFALQQAPSNPDVVDLLVQIKSRQSRLTGLWWRATTRLQALSEPRRAALLLAGFGLYCLLVIPLDASGSGLVKGVHALFWGGLAYAWASIALFERAVEREVESVRLRSDF